jgi:hypothetical protein
MERMNGLTEDSDSQFHEIDVSVGVQYSWRWEHQLIQQKEGAFRWIARWDHAKLQYRHATVLQSRS